MRGRITRSHSEFFTDWHSDSGRIYEGRDRPFFHWTRGNGEPLVVCHPYLGFDAASHDSRHADLLCRPMNDIILRSRNRYRPMISGRIPTFQESFDIDSDMFESIAILIEDSERLFRITDDEILYDDTGFWSAESGHEHYYGIGLDSARKLTQDIDCGVLVLVLANRSSIMVFTMHDISAPREFSLDVLLNNNYLPFAEQRRAISQALDSMGSWKRTEASLSDLGRIRRIPRLEACSLDPANEDKRFDLKPLAVVKAHKEDFFHSIVVRREFEDTPWPELNNISHVMATYSEGYWHIDDIQPSHVCILNRFAPYFTRTCTVLECVFSSADRYTFD